MIVMSAQKIKPEPRFTYAKNTSVQATIKAVSSRTGFEDFENEEVRQKCLSVEQNC